MRRNWAAVIRWDNRDEVVSRHWTRSAAARAARAHVHRPGQALLAVPAIRGRHGPRCRGGKRGACVAERGDPMSDVLARAAEVLLPHLTLETDARLWDADEYAAYEAHEHESFSLAREAALKVYAAKIAQVLADAGLLAESAPVAGGNGAVGAEPCPPRPTTHETLDSDADARVTAQRAATEAWKSEAERLRELLDEAHAKIERMEEL